MAGRKYNLQELQRRYANIREWLGDEAISRFISLRTGRPISERTLRDYLKGYKPIPKWVANRVNDLYIQFLEKKYFRYLRRDEWLEQAIEELIEWLAGMEINVEGKYVEGLMRELVKEVESRAFEVVLTIPETGNFAWLNPGSPSKLRGDVEIIMVLLLYRYYKGSLFLYPDILIRRVPMIMWNPKNRRIMRAEYADIFQKIMDLGDKIIGTIDVDTLGELRGLEGYRTLAFATKEG